MTAHDLICIRQKCINQSEHSPFQLKTHRRSCLILERKKHLTEKLQTFKCSFSLSNIWTALNMFVEKSKPISSTMQIYFLGAG